LPAFILQPDQNSEVIDACAAPGMKTTHLASLMNNNGKIWAFDRDKNRCKALSSMLKDSNVKNAEVLNSDFLKEDTTADKYSKVSKTLKIIYWELFR
jgi:putative methyltransferase